MARRVAVAAGLLAALFPGCASTSRGDVFLSPFCVDETSPSGTRRLSALYPFFEKETRADGSETTALRPIYITEDPPDPSVRTEALYPLGLFSRDPERGERTDRVVPLFSYKERIGNEGLERDWFVFPVVFGGDSEAGEKYFAVFPFGGSFKGFFTLDEVEFVLFPLYVTSRDGEYETVSYLWPFTLFGEGGKRKTTRVLPFYAHSEKEGSYEQGAFLWPLFQYRRTDLSGAHPKDSRFAFPFYGRETSDVSAKTVVLWPLFSWGETERADGEPSWFVDAPWPLYKRYESDGISRTRVWPISGVHTSDELESRFFLWPFVWDRTEHTPSRRLEQRMVIPFSYRIESFEPGATEPRSSLRQVWPLARDERQGARSEFRTLSLEPGPLLDRLDDHYGFLWTFYRRREDRAAGAGDEEILLGLYRQWWEPGFRSVDVPFLYHLHERDDESTESFLLGLLRLDHHAGGTDLSVFGLTVHSAPRAPREESEP